MNDMSDHPDEHDAAAEAIKARLRELAVDNWQLAADDDAGALLLALVGAGFAGTMEHHDGDEIARRFFAGGGHFTVDLRGVHWRDDAA